MDDAGTALAQVDAERKLLGTARWSRIVDLESQMMLDTWISEITTERSTLRRRRRVRAALLRQGGVKWRRDLLTAQNRMNTDPEDVEALFEGLRVYSLMNFAWPARPELLISAPSRVTAAGVLAGPEPPPGNGPAFSTPAEPEPPDAEEDVPPAWRGWRGGTDDPRAPWNRSKRRTW